MKSMNLYLRRICSFFSAATLFLNFFKNSTVICASQVDISFITSISLSTRLITSDDSGNSLSNTSVRILISLLYIDCCVHASSAIVSGFTCCGLQTRHSQLCIKSISKSGPRFLSRQSEQKERLHMQQSPQSRDSRSQFPHQVHWTLLVDFLESFFVTSSKHRRHRRTGRWGCEQAFKA